MTVTVTGGQTDAGTYTATAEALTGTAAGNYQMPSTKPTTNFTIGKANPTVTDVKVAEPAAIYESTELAQIKLTHAEGDTPGTVALVAVQTLTVGTKDYNWTFTPDAGNNYNSTTGTVTLTVRKDALKSIAITTPPTNTTYTYGDAFNPTGMGVTATYESTATKVVTSEVEISPKVLTVGTTELTITYNGVSTTQAITVNPKTVNATVTVDPNSYVYTGEAITPTKVVVKDGDTEIPASEYTVGYSDNTNVGNGTVKITDKDGGNYNVSGSATFTITAKSITGANVSVSGPVTYTGSALTPEPTVTLDGKPLSKGTDYTVSYEKNVDVGTATVTVTGTGNYSSTASGTFAIGKADLTVDGTGTAKGAYGDTLSSLKIEGLTVKLNGVTVGGSWALTGDTIPNVGDSGEYTATFTPSTGAGNYNELKVEVKLEIAQAEYTGTKTANTSAKFGTAGTYDLSALLQGIDGAAPGTAATTSTDIFEGTPAVSDKTLSYKLKAEAKPTTTGTITAPVTSTNYKDFNLTITVKVTEKDVPTLTIDPITVTYDGKPVPGNSIKGTAKVGDTTVPGTWSFINAPTTVAQSGAIKVKFTPDEDHADNYAEVESTVTVSCCGGTQEIQPQQIGSCALPTQIKPAVMP